MKRDGFVYLPRRSELDLVEVIEALGHPIYIEEVRVDGNGRALVKSWDGISWHTDHHRADTILWHGREAAEAGGETLVVDGLAAFSTLSAHHRAALREVVLLEHSVFDGDSDRHPMITGTEDRVALYYSLWLVDDELPEAQAAALRAFEDAVSRCPHHRFRLERGDLLAIDNRRMLHARTAIEGTRHLRRYWLATAST
ncbi:MAG: TauD/TfdA family dioxygenase [Deltaproteobacteria bacterium]|jgi:alpha-ketoglutarate-dependent taurine dioxygenase